MGIHARTLREYEERSRLLIEVTDSEFPWARATFNFEFLSGRATARDQVLTLTQFCVGRKSRQRMQQEFNATMIRLDFPWAAWLSSARARAIAHSSQQEPTLLDQPDDSPRAEFYRDIASQYRKLLEAGHRNPVSLIARERDVVPATARTWVRRARERGYLGPARGKFAGEGGSAKGKVPGEVGSARGKVAGEVGSAESPLD